MRKEARVVAVFKDRYKIEFDGKVELAEITGRFSYYSNELRVYPSVGDYVELDKGRISKVINRKNILMRKAPGSKLKHQVIASNIDYAFIVTSLNKEFNIRRVERYVALVESFGIIPIIVFTKLDLCVNPYSYINNVESDLEGIRYIMLSSITGEGVEEVENIIKEGVTACFIGSSGVGKSTLINYLCKGEVQEVQGVREKDDKGKHTTTHRELFKLKNGGSVIDTPGMRELQFWNNEKSTNIFEDIEHIAKGCKFKNCKHIDEPSCEVKKAVEEGIIEKKRFKNYMKLKKELYIASLRNDIGEAISYKKKIKKKSKIENYSIKK